MDKARLVGLIILLTFFLYVTSYFLPVEDYYILVFADIFFFLIAFLASFLCFSNYLKFGKSLEGKCWMLLGIGLFLWGVGELFWAWYELVEKIYPFPSIGDIYYTLGYLSMILATLYYFSYIQIPLKTRKIYLVALVSLAYGLASFFFVLYPIIISDLSLVEKTFLLIYPFLDVYLIFCGLLLVEAFRGGALSRVWLIISLAFLFTGFADTIFSYLDWNGLYELGSPYDYVDFLWIAGYLLFVYAPIYERIALRRLVEKVKSKRKSLIFSF
ncbi:MAG: hypothetical protein DRP00_01280 [Candidatus Aenigmatarchaeota archaeon]|nr:MAG: hypothetical protein DRP00_01280 [Candidatus Aenigmarchaeota archaeon]